MLHIKIPYRSDKDLGKAYNEAMQSIPDGDWACFIDYDVMFLTPDAIHHITEYTNRFPKTGMFTCFTNRIGKLSKMQMLSGVRSENSDIRHHIGIAERQKQHLYKVTKIERDISGFLMVINKEVWKEYPFPEIGKALGVDTKYNRIIRQVGHQVLRMDGIYMWHTYRLINGVKNKEHLQP